MPKTVGKGLGGQVDSNRTGNPEGSRTTGHLDSVRLWTSVILGLLAFQFLTGMGLNLFATFPEASTSAIAGIFAAMMTGPVSAVHLMVGFLLPVLSVVVLAVLVDSGESSLATLAAVGLGSIAFAGLCGLGFVYSGFQNNVYSYLMAIGFISAFASYFSLFVSYRAQL